MPGGTLPTGKIEFIQYRKPNLQSGLYRVDVTQTLSGTGVSEQFDASLTFAASGPRFSLQPDDVYAVFPPDGSLGEHANVLPHVVFNRVTLPWERSAHATRDEIPWLALLVLDEEDSTRVTLTPATAGQLTGGGAVFPNLPDEPDHPDDEQVLILDMEQSLLAELMPGLADLALTAHTRRGKDGATIDNRERAVLFAARLPKRNGLATVFLVSLEGRLDDGGFDYQGASGTQKVRLVALKRWRFANLSPSKSFSGLLLALDRNPGVIRLTSSDSAVDELLDDGRAPLPHRLRQGDRTVSWYRGPLTPGGSQIHFQLPVRAADALLHYNADYGMFDISYATAWELGRLLALRDKRFSTELFKWKRTAARRTLCAEQVLLHGHLPYQNRAETNGADMPVNVRAWFDRLRLLEGVPFAYLLPDERMLPKESIRFFQLDAYWVDCLLDGAYSVGRVTSNDLQNDCDSADCPVGLEHQPSSGFLLRSDVVAGWPDLQVDAYTEAVTDNLFIPTAQKLGLLRMARLSDHVLLGLFTGELKTLDIHQKPEALHFGLDPETGGLPNQKTKRDGQTVDVVYVNEPKRVVDLADLALKLGGGAPDATSADFAMAMIEGVEKVRLVVRSHEV